MRISDWSSDVCSSDLADVYMHRLFALRLALLKEAPGLYAPVGETLAYPAAWLREAWTEDQRMLEARSSRSSISSAQARIIEEQIGRASSRERVGQNV